MNCIQVDVDSEGIYRCIGCDMKYKYLFRLFDVGGLDIRFCGRCIQEMSQKLNESCGHEDTHLSGDGEIEICYGCNVNLKCV